MLVGKWKSNKKTCSGYYNNFIISMGGRGEREYDGVRFTYWSHFTLNWRLVFVQYICDAIEQTSNKFEWNICSVK